MDSEAIVVRASRNKTLLLLAPAIGVVALGLWLLLAEPEFIKDQSGYNNPLFIHGLGWTAVLFSGLGVLLAVWRLLSSKPGLILDKNGVKIFTVGQETFLPWRDVTGLSIFKVRRNRMLVLHLRDPDEFIQSIGKPRRPLARASFKLCGSPIAVSSSTMALSFADMHQLFERFISRYGGAA